VAQSQLRQHNKPQRRSWCKIFTCHLPNYTWV